MTTDFLIALAITSTAFVAVLACYALHIAITTNIRVSAFEKSTHNVQYVPLDQIPTDESDDDEDINKKIKRGEDASWAGLRDMDELNQGGTIPLD